MFTMTVCSTAKWARYQSSGSQQYNATSPSLSFSSSTMYTSIHTNNTNTCMFVAFVDD